MLNLGPIINQGNPGGRGVSGLGNPGGEGLEVEEIREEGGSKTLAIRRGGVDFFWNNPLYLIQPNNKRYFLNKNSIFFQDKICHINI